VVVVDLWGFERGPDVDVVALATPGGAPAGVGSATAMPPPNDSAPTIRSAPAPARDWLMCLRSIAMPFNQSPEVSVRNNLRKGITGTRGRNRG
jgi:hypothetical protein